MAPEDWKRVQLLLRPEVVELVDEFRRRESDLPDRNEALRRLIARGLESAGISVPK